MAKDPDTVKLSYDKFLFKYGRNAAVGATAEIIWDGSAAYPGFLTAEAACELISDDADDKVGGGAATLIRVWGQGDDGLEITEDVIPNGDTGAVALANDYAVIYRAWIVDSEDVDPVTGPNHGTITIRKTAGPVTMALILPTFGSTLMCIYRVPSNLYGEVIGAEFFANEGKEATVTLKTRKDRTDERAWRIMFAVEQFQNQITLDFTKEPKFLYPGEDIIAMADSAAAGVIISGHFSVRLYDL